MSFNTGGHVVYLTEPQKTSAVHTTSEANASLVVFTTVPAGGTDADPSEQILGSIYPEGAVSGRIVG